MPRMPWSRTSLGLSLVPGTPSVVLLLLLIGFGTRCFFPPTASAQRTKGTVNIGLQVGPPGGVTGKFYRSPQTAYDVLLTTNAEDLLEVRVHRLHERALPDSLLHWYLGPGVLVGAKNLDRRPPTLKLGLTAQVGLNFYAKQFEVFLHVTPAFRVLSAIKPQLGGSVGLRYHLPGP